LTIIIIIIIIIIITMITFSDEPFSFSIKDLLNNVDVIANNYLIEQIMVGSTLVCCHGYSKRSYKLVIFMVQETAR